MSQDAQEIKFRQKQNNWLRMFQNREGSGKFVIYDWKVSLTTKRNFNQRIIYRNNKSGKNIVLVNIMHLVLFSSNSIFPILSLGMCNVISFFRWDWKHLSRVTQQESGRTRIQKQDSLTWWVSPAHTGDPDGK